MREDLQSEQAQHTREEDGGKDAHQNRFSEGMSDWDTSGSEPDSTGFRKETLDGAHGRR